MLRTIYITASLSGMISSGSGSHEALAHELKPRKKYSVDDRAHLMWREPGATRDRFVYLIDKKTNNVCLLFKFIVNIQTAQNVMTYWHSPLNSPSLL